MEGYDGQRICILMFYRAVWTVLLVLIHSILHKKLKWAEFLVVSSSSRWQKIFKFYDKVHAKSLTATKHVKLVRFCFLYYFVLRR